MTLNLNKHLLPSINRPTVTGTLDQPNMKSSVAVILISMLAFASAFAPTAFTRGRSATSLFSEKPEAEEEEGLDLDLGEMFEMFDAADKEETFDEAIKKVKKDE